MFNRRTFNKLKHQLIFIGLSVLLLVGIALLPNAPSTLDAPVDPISLITAVPTSALDLSLDSVVTP